ncbi:hypothetical protein COT72_05510 [archaeon CG10_big_fil_rev_8_21_14_0_10_43_11]|nr:MAG: hypothetical protein COT72_05510 [archaeon CG10_big_fil_rev_8_21_14_0_10_43_11]
MNFGEFIIFVGFLVVGVAIMIAVLSSSSYVTRIPEEYTRFAQCLTQKGAKLYGIAGTTHYDEAQTLFGISWEYVTFIDCSVQRSVCIASGVNKYPTWMFADGSKRTQPMTFSQLASKTGCALPSII